MPRRREIPKREVLPDPVYQSTLVTKFINTVMQAGKRSTAEGIMYGAFDIIKDKTGDDPLKVFKKAVDNVKPSLVEHPLARGVRPHARRRQDDGRETRE
jgi:small subunit ribosomal protein S7